VKATTLHRSDFVQQNAANTKINKLPLWPFLDKNHLTGLKIHFWSKTNIYSPFLSQRDKGYTEYRKTRVIISTDKKGSKIQNNRKIEKSLQVAQKRGTKILQVPNPANPLKSSNREKSV